MGVPGQWKVNSVPVFSLFHRSVSRQVLRRQTSYLYHFDENYHILWLKVLDSTILMQRELSTFPLAPNYLHKLSSAGYITVDDLKDVSPTELSEGKFIDFFFAVSLPTQPCLVTKFSHKGE